MHPVMTTRTSQITRDLETSAVKRSSMTESRSSGATHAARRYTTNSMQLGDTVDQLRLLDDSVYNSETNPALSERSNVAGSSVPLTTTQKELVGQRMSSANALTKNGHPISTKVIHHKTVQMVAATDALKPTTPTRKAAGPRASTQGAQSKGLAKLLGRIYSKSASPESEAFKKRSKLGSGEKDFHIIRSASQLDKTRPAVSSTEIRLNEDLNLNRNKVQQMMGVQSICQPVSPALIRSQSYAHQSVAAVGSEEEQRALAEPRQSQGHGHEHGFRHTSWSLANPFDTEEDFECNLDQGILHVSPAGSSTPRIRIQRDSDSILSDCSIHDFDGDGESLGQVNLAKVVQLGKRDKLNEPTIRQVTFQTAALDQRRLSRGQCLHPNGPTGNAKKHPSPSKRDLEELERAFRQYGLPSGPYQDGDADELAAASPLVLYARERN
ncbi:hypothetical protein E4U21_002502 [Claviceps maximensis]|nr:hypothetical protein E4U21_002502 [Claviceps maximensis]